MTFMGPEIRQQPSLITTGGAANRSAEEHQPAVILARAEDLSRIVEVKPCPVLPSGEVDDGKLFHESEAR
jgi:hypothetical protein